MSQHCYGKALVLVPDTASRRRSVPRLSAPRSLGLAKRLFFFVRTNTGFDHTQLTRVVAWPSPTLLLLARSGSQRCSFEHLQVVVPHTFVAKVASTPLGPCILYSSPPAREHCTGLPADHAYCTAVCQRVRHVQHSSRVSSITLRFWAEPEAATQREQGHGWSSSSISPRPAPARLPLVF